VRWLLILSLLGVACATKTREAAPAPTVSKPEPKPQPPLALDANAPLAQELASQVAWQLAERGDPMDLAVLAGQLGAARLEELVREGGRAGVVALAAFEHAPDAHAERARLCALLPRLLPPHRRTGLAALERIVQQPGWGEVIDPDADATCDAALSQLGEPPLSDAERDLIDSARQRLRTPK
jgi:hypothetical protein